MAVRLLPIDTIMHQDFCYEVLADSWKVGDIPDVEFDQLTLTVEKEMTYRFVKTFGES